VLDASWRSSCWISRILDPGQLASLVVAPGLHVHCDDSAVPSVVLHW
jgi:hypothetical protein